MKKNRQQVQHHLRRDGFRWTKPREIVLAIFEKNPMPLTVSQVYDKLTSQQIDLVSVYRTIKLFCRRGIVTTVDHIAEGKRYELSDHYRPHHHHLICRICGKVEDFMDCLLETIETKILSAKRFKVEKHDLNFFGLCRACQK